jgi:hypothetical protein
MVQRQNAQIWLGKKILPPRFPYIYSFPNTTQMFFVLDTSLTFPYVSQYSDFYMKKHPNVLVLHNYNIANSAKEFPNFSKQLCLN